jgi:hypothetical protein
VHSPQATDAVLTPEQTFDRTLSMRFHRLRSVLPTLVIVGALSLAGCADNDPVDPGNPQDISITVDPTSLTVSQGEESSVTVTLTSTGGYTNDVIVIAENSPDGVLIEGATIEGGSGSAVLDIYVASGALLGTANIGIRAIGFGVSETSTVLAMTVAAGP